jgi:transcriptional regulator with XRE-family HTH domain
MARTPTTGSRLSAWLTHRNLTMRAAARQSGVSVQTISTVAAGESDITIAKLVRICRVLDCSLVEFFGPLPGRERAA